MMRSRLLLRTFLVMSLFAGVAMSLSAKTYSKKTFLAPRAIGTNLPMELTTWHEYPYQKLEKRAGHKIQGHLQLTPFYQGSDEKSDVGKYFGIGNGKNSFTVGSSENYFDNKVDISGLYFIHDFGNASATQLAGKITLEPKQEIWGARLDYFQDFGHPVSGLFFKASMPIVYVENNVGMNVSDEQNVTVGGKEFSLKDFFSGNVEVTATMDPENLQSPLTKAKMVGHESKFGVADINLALGYKIHQSKSGHAFLSLQGIIPTGPRPHGEYLFSPVMGNGKHFGFGARLDGAVELWSNKKSAIRLLLDADYRYLFEATEDRTVGVKGFDITDDGKTGLSNMAHYYLAGKIGQVNQPLFPAANILTQGIRVKPGNQFEILADLSFKSGGFVLDLGYNFFYKDQEDCWIKSWTDDTYVLASATYDTSNAMQDPSDSLHDLNLADLDVDAVKTPSAITNKVFAGLGYLFNYTKSVPGMVGIGGSYEFVSDNSALENYSVWLKLGVSF